MIQSVEAAAKATDALNVRGGTFFTFILILYNLTLHKEYAASIVQKNITKRGLPEKIIADVSRCLLFYCPAFQFDFDLVLF